MMPTRPRLLTAVADKGAAITAVRVTDAPSGHSANLAGIERELESLALRFTVTRAVTRDVSRWVADDVSLDLIVDDVLSRWQEREPDSRAYADFEAFWNRYANGVEWAPPESGDQYRVEFCPDVSPALFDTDDYFTAVWRAHVADLGAKKNGAAKS